MLPGPPGGIGAGDQVDDAGPSGPHRGAGGAQPHPPRRGGGRPILPPARLRPGRGAGAGQGGHGRHEPGVLHPQPGYRRHGDLRQLHEPGQHPGRGGGPHLRP